MKRDDLIFDIIEKEHQRQLKGIELIASENFVSDQRSRKRYGEGFRTLPQESCLQIQGMA